MTSTAKMQWPPPGRSRETADIAPERKALAKELHRITGLSCRPRWWGVRIGKGATACSIASYSYRSGPYGPALVRVRCCNVELTVEPDELVDLAGWVAALAEHRVGGGLPANDPEPTTPMLWWPGQRSYAWSPAADAAYCRWYRAWRQYAA